MHSSPQPYTENNVKNNPIIYTRESSDEGGIGVGIEEQQQEQY